MNNLTSATKRLVERYQDWYRSFQQDSDQVIHADRASSGTASFYEGAKGTVNWQQQHLFRKSVILKILNRELVGNENNEIAALLIKELIKEGHLPNDSLPQDKVQRVQEIIDRHVFILGHAPEQERGRTKVQLQNWLLNIAACEIEHTLTPQKQKDLLDYITEVMNQRLEGEALEELKEQKREIQISLACQETLFDLDRPLVTYYLLLKKFPDWNDPSQEQLIDLAVNIYSLWGEVRESLNHPRKEIRAICRKYEPSFLLLSDVLKENLGSVEQLKNPKWTEKRIKQVYHERIEQLRYKLFRTTFFSSLVVLFLSLLSFSILKILVGAHTTFLSWTVIGLSVLGLTVLTGLLTVTISPPPSKNLSLIIMGTMRTIYEGDRQSHSLKALSRPNLVSRVLTTLFHLLTFSIAAVLIIWLLILFNLPLLSALIFLAFFSLMLTVRYRLEQRVKRLEVRKRKSPLQNTTEILSLPLRKLERWLTAKWKNRPLIIAGLGSIIDG